MALIDASAAQVMELVSELLEAQDRLARQRVTIWQLVVALKAAQAAQRELVDLLDQVLADG